MKINVPILGNKKLDFYAESLSIVVLVYKPQGTGFTTWFDMIWYCLYHYFFELFDNQVRFLILYLL